MLENNSYKKEEKYYPMLVSINSERADKDNEFLNLWERFQSFPENKKSILGAGKLVDFIYGASQRYNLDDTKTEEFSRTVRQYFFNEIQDGQFARKIAELCNTSNESGLGMLSSIKNIQPEEEVVTKRNLVTGQTYSAPKPASTINFSSKSPSISQQSKLSSTTPQITSIVQIPIKKALKLYPKLESQTLTGSPIISKPFLKPVNPTIKNWLTIYEELMGVGKKGAIDRGNFLFHSEATKNLPTEERQKLAQVFKSADEDSNLKIDTIQGKIIFSIASGEINNSSKNFTKNIETQKKADNNFVTNNFKKSVNNPQKTFSSPQNFNSNQFSSQQPIKPQLSSGGFSQQTTPVKKSVSNNFSQQKKPNVNQKSSQSNFKNFTQSRDNFTPNSQQSSMVNNFGGQSSKKDFQVKKNNFVNDQSVGSLNNFSNNLSNEKIGGMGSGDFNVPKQDSSSLNDLNSSNEENISFTSRHVLPTEKKE